MSIVYGYCLYINSNKNPSGDEIAKANVNFFTTTSYNTSKYNPLLNIQHDAGRGAASGCMWPRGFGAPLQPRPYLL